MKLAVIISLLFLFQINLSGQNQDIKVYDRFDDFEELLTKKDGKIYVLNFWATWCAPCIKEMPFFEALAKKYEGENLEVIFVSLDFKNQLDSRLKPFVDKKNLQSPVVLLGDSRVNSWIDRVSPDWSGAIPATYVYKNNSKAFYEQEFHSLQELETIITPFINK